MVSEVLVLGGGLAGAAAALELAQAGVPVRVLERSEKAHHKVCGEFVSIEVQHDLTRLGIDLAELGAVPIDRIRLIGCGRRIEAAMPFRALGVSRAVLDEAMLHAAQLAGAVIERGVKVTGMHGQDITTSHGSRRAARVLLATGKHDVRGLARMTLRASRSYLGFKMHWQLASAQAEELGSAVELVMFGGGYVGFQRIASDTMNMSLLVETERFGEIGARWELLVEDLCRVGHVARRLKGARALFARPLTIANLPYGYVCDPDIAGPGNLFRLGDQGGLTAPLTGDGMAIATRSARMAVACCLAELGPTEYHRQLHRSITPQVRRAMLLQSLVGMPSAMPLALGLLGLWPSLLGAVAGLTRIVERN